MCVLLTLLPPTVGSTCCSYAGRHTTCREYCQAIFRTDSTPTVSQINAVQQYCQSHSTQLLNCVNNFTKSYPIRSPIDSELRLLPSISLLFLSLVTTSPPFLFPPFSFGFTLILSSLLL